MRAMEGWAMKRKAKTTGGAAAFLDQNKELLHATSLRDLVERGEHVGAAARKDGWL